MEEIKVLTSILPICSHCRKIRDDKGNWKRIEDDIGEYRVDFQMVDEKRNTSLIFRKKIYFLAEISNAA